MEETQQTCVIVGAGHAGVALAVALRQGGWEGPITMIGDEGGLPYERPPLSKGFLAGDREAGEFLLRPADFFDKNGIELVEGRVETIDREARTVTLESGETLAYGKLALATGAAPVRLPIDGADLPGVHVLRTLADVQGIRDDLAQLAGAGTASARVVLIGGGYIGLEAASSLRALGHEVTVLEAAERVLARVTAPPVSAFYQRIHGEEGVRIETGVAVEAIEGSARVERVRLADGGSVDADLVIMGVGVRADVGLAEAAGLEVDAGIVVDACCRTSDPDIVALGDCARVRREEGGRLICLESVPNAREQARVAAAALRGESVVDDSVPWFWSDQYDLTLQMAGDSSSHDEVVVRGDIDSGRSFAVFYLDQGRLVAAECVARPREFMLAKKLLAEGASPDPVLLADESIQARDLMKQLLAG